MIDGGADAAFGLGFALPFENIFPRIHEFDGIDMLAVHQDFIMQMGSGATSGAPQKPDNLTMRNLLTALDFQAA